MEIQAAGRRSTPMDDDEQQKIPTIMFDDSIVDPDDNNQGLTKAKANFSPYGYDFPIVPPM